MAEEVVKSVTEELNCSICMNRFRVPKMLECIHSFCESCLEDYMKKLNGKEMTCPMCRKVCALPTGVKGLQTNIYLVNLCDKIDLYEKLKPSNVTSKMCESCKKSTKVTAFCIDCKYTICKNCDEQHSMFPALQSHTIEQIGKVDHDKLKRIQKNAMVPSCDLHSPEKLRFYCKTCSKLICRECTVVQHPKPDHIFVEAPSQFEEVKNILSKLLGESPAVLQFVSGYVKDGESGKNEITMKSKALLKEVQDRYKKVKSEMESQLDTQFKEMERVMQQHQESKESNIDESVKLASDWLRRMESTRAITQKVIQENNMWELLGLSNNLIGSFKTLRDDKREFQWGISDLNFEMLFTPSNIPTIPLGECFNTNDHDTVICEYNKTFMKFYFDRKKSIINRTRLQHKQDQSNSCTEENLSSIPLQFKIHDGSFRFSATCNGSYHIFGIDKWLLVFPLNSEPYYTVFTFKDIDAPIGSLALSDNGLSLVFSDKPNTIYGANVNFSYYSEQYKQQRKGEVLKLESMSNIYPENLSRYDISYNIIHINRINNVFLITAENAKFFQYQENVGDYFVDVKAPTSHIGFKKLSILSFSSQNGYKTRYVFKYGARKMVNMYNIVCFILWGKATGVQGRKQQLLITQYESSSEQNTRIWKVLPEMGLPRACYWDQSYNVLRVCNAFGKLFTLPY